MCGQCEDNNINHIEHNKNNIQLVYNVDIVYADNVHFDIVYLNNVYVDNKYIKNEYVETM